MQVLNNRENGENMVDIVSIGEALIDLTQTGTDEKGTPRYAAFPGGAPANVAVAAARLEANTGFIGLVGEDSFGHGLIGMFEEEGVDTSQVSTTGECPTTLAIVSIDENGERSFAFYRDPGSDTRITAEYAVDAVKALEPGILHFGSLSFTHEPSRSATLAAVEIAREKGALISYDPNYRPALWQSEEEAVERMKEPLGLVDILKVSDEEMVMLTGSSDLEEGSLLFSEHGISLVMVTLGSEGVFYRFGETTGRIKGIKVKVADTNGAGDTFLGAVLMQIAGDEFDLKEELLPDFIAFANKAASITCSRPGAIPAMPRLDEVK